MDLISFAQMLCSRLCHDLITPIGAISSGFEVLASCEEKERANLLDLTHRSAETALRRLTFYRAAFGYSLGAQNASFTVLKTLIEDFLEPLKIHLEWPWARDIEQSLSLVQNKNMAAIARLLLNGVLMGAEGMPYGGTLAILRTPKSPVYFSLRFTSESLVTLRPEVRAILQDPETPPDDKLLSPLIIQTLFLKMIAQSLNMKLVLKVNGSQEIELEVIEALAT